MRIADLVGIIFSDINTVTILRAAFKYVLLRIYA